MQIENSSRNRLVYKLIKSSSGASFDTSTASTMYELRRLVKASVSERCFKKAVFLVVLCLTSSAEASSTNKLEGEVLLPTVTCRPNCPKPFASSTSADLRKERNTINQCWNNDVQYRFVHKEFIFDYDDRHFRELVGSQTSCNKHANGSYTCDQRSEEYCPFYVALAFNVREPSNISVGVSKRSLEDLTLTEKHLSGKVMTSAYILGSVSQRPTVRFSLMCMDNTRCLDDSITAISIQYRCTRDIQTTC